MAKGKSQAKYRAAYASFVDLALARPAFLKAWEGVGSAGIGSGDAMRKMWALITDSDWHTKFLVSETEDIMAAAADPADTVDFAAKLLNQLRTIAASYMIMGVMVGTLAVTWDAESKGNSG
ncbi:MAG: hypothetical protein WBY44_12435 [Bryobacteraceae bacterium]